MRRALVVIILIVSTNNSYEANSYGHIAHVAPSGSPCLDLNPYSYPYPSVYRNEFCWLCGEASGQIACSKWHWYCCICVCSVSVWAKLLTLFQTFVQGLDKSSSSSFCNRTPTASQGFLFILTIKQSLGQSFEHFCSSVDIHTYIMVLLDVVSTKSTGKIQKQNYHIYHKIIRKQIGDMRLIYCQFFLSVYLYISVLVFKRTNFLYSLVFIYTKRIM